MASDWFTATVRLVNAANTAATVCMGAANGAASQVGPFARGMWLTGDVGSAVLIVGLALDVSTVFCAAAVFWPGQAVRYPGYHRAAAVFNLCVLLWMVFVAPALSA